MCRKSCQTGLSWAGDESWQAGSRPVAKAVWEERPLEAPLCGGMSNRGKYVRTLPAAATTQEEMPADGLCRQLELEGARREEGGGP